ncbi:7043_t:CDS:2, partial [Dentiscutata erythropus]
DELEIQKSPVSSKHKVPPASKKSAKKKKSNTPDDLLYIANNIITTEIKDLDDIKTDSLDLKVLVLKLVNNKIFKVV